MQSAISKESRVYCDLEGASKMKLQLLDQTFRKEDDHSKENDQ